MSEVFIKKEYIYHGTGFPVTIFNAPFKKVQGEAVPVFDLQKLELGIARLVLLKPSLLKGKEIRFLRIFTHHSLSAFAQYFGLTAAGVKKWEQQGNTDYRNDFLIRQVIAKQLGLEYGFPNSFTVHQSILKQAEYRQEGGELPFRIPFSKMKDDPFFSSNHLSL